MSDSHSLNDSETRFAPDKKTKANPGPSLPVNLPYQIIRELGKGGMGKVFLARQEIPERDVALKVISGVSREHLLRFEMEFKVLAMMSHPHIATIYDVGVMDSGEPYFTMEYVANSQLITDYCRENQLSLRARLLLFLQVCRGVSHAHQRAVVHRDLKPGNILVTSKQGQGVVKIIDFGIAKPLTGDAANSNPTSTGQLIGTPAYMSPEQLSHGHDRIDTRTDIYALGMVLFEMLTGLHPIDIESLANKPFDERLRIFREEELPLASKRLSKVDPVTGKKLVGDLDAIIGMTLEKDPDKRYPTVLSLIDDISNYLDQKPVMAKRPSLHYRFGKYLLRNKFSVGLGIAVFVAILGISWATFSQAHKNAARESATSLNELFESVQWSPHPRGTEKNLELKTLEILERELADWPGAGDPLKAKTYNTLGEFYVVYRNYPRAIKHFRHSLEIKSVPILDAAKYRNNLSRALRLAGELKEAEAHALQALSEFKDNGGSPADQALAELSLGQVYMRSKNAWPKAEELLANASEVLAQTKGETHEDRLRALSSYAYVCFRQQKYARAEAIYREVLDKGSYIYGKVQPFMLSAHKNLGICLRGQKKWAEAEEVLQESIAILREINPADAPIITNNLYSLGLLLREAGELERASVVFGEVIERRKGEGDTEGQLSALNWQAKTLWSLDRPAESLHLLNQGLDLCREKQLRTSQSSRTMNNLTYYLLALNMNEEAHEIIKEAMTIQWPETIAASSDNYRRYLLARSMAETGQEEQAEALLSALLGNIAQGQIKNKSLTLEIQVADALFRLGRGEQVDLSQYLERLNDPEHRDLYRRVKEKMNR